MSHFLLHAAIVTTLLILKLDSAVGLGISDGRAFLAIESELFCGAAIINHQYALTAAHCVVNRSINNIKLVVKSTSEDTGSFYFNVTELIVHEKFNKTTNYDIALIKVDPIEFSANLKPIEMMGSCEELPDGSDCLVSGWGFMKGNKKPRDLHAVSVNIVNQETPKNIFNNTLVGFKIVDSNFCANVTEGKKDACSDDSGAPLVCNGKLFGVVSTGYDCGLKESPGIYTRVSEYLDWINEKTRATTP